MKENEKMQESKNPSKVGLTAELIRWKYLIIWKVYSTQNNNPFQVLITSMVYSIQLNANLTF